jgi:Polyprenyl synthetase
MASIQKAHPHAAPISNDSKQLTAMLAERLDESRVLPELRHALLQLASADVVQLAQGRYWAWIIPELQKSLGGDQIDITPFLLAWATLHLATSRLDHVQDNDPDDQLQAIGGVSVQINTVLGGYALATGLLDLLPPATVPTHRLFALHRLWSTQLLRTAGGQQRDLLQAGHASPFADLTVYQESAQAKSGAMFTLAFGGVASLLTDDQGVINCYSAAGELFGTLVQYHDDLLDREAQQGEALTLPSVLRTTASAEHERRAAGNLPAFWRHLYAAYLAHLGHLSAGCDNRHRDGLRAIFARAFEQAHAVETPGDR